MKRGERMSRYDDGFRDGFREGYKAGEQGLFITTWESHLDDEYSTDDNNPCLLKNNKADWSKPKHYVVTKITTIKKHKHKKKLRKP